MGFLIDSFLHDLTFALQRFEEWWDSFHKVYPRWVIFCLMLDVRFKTRDRRQEDLMIEKREGRRDGVFLLKMDFYALLLQRGLEGLGSGIKIIRLLGPFYLGGYVLSDRGIWYG